jgi:holliday junction DNA helicase RuvA
MIAGLTGQVVGKFVDAVHLYVNGVIYRVGTSTTTLASIADSAGPVTLHTHLIVREDQMALYGFSSVEELRVFETVITVNGVGPKLGCAILSRFPVDQLQSAIQEGNVDLLATIPGVGKKTAARLIVDLRGKLPAGAVSAGLEGMSGSSEVVEALRALGYSAGEAAEAVARTKVEPGATIEERIVAALHELSSN